MTPLMYLIPDNSQETVRGMLVDIGTTVQMLARNG